MRTAKRWRIGRYTPEMLAACLILALCSGGLDLLVTHSTGVVDRMDGETGASWSARLLAFPAYAYVVYAFMLEPVEFLRRIRQAWIWFLLIGMCVFSTFWSMSPMDTLIRAALLIAMSMVPVALAPRFDREQLMLVIGGTVTFLVVAGIVAFAVMPSVAQHQDQLKPAIRGLFLQKNIAGRTDVIAILVGIVLFWSRRAVLPGAVFAVAGFVGVLTALSGSALVNTVLAGASIPLVALHRRNYKVSSVLISILVVLGLAFYFSGLYGQIYTDVLAGLGKDPTLTNRTYIWQMLIQRLGEGGWLLGYGYDGFWTSPDGAYLTFDPRYFVPGHAHNGLLQTVVALGVVGGVVLCGAFVKTLANKVRLVWQSPDRLVMFDLVFMVYFFLTNITEQSIMEYSSFIWLVFLTIACWTDRNRVLIIQGPSDRFDRMEEGRRNGRAVRATARGRSKSSVASAWQR